MPSGVYNHYKLIKTVIVNCEICNKEFQTKPAIRKRGYGRFCSNKCQIEWQRTTGKRAGENSYSWKNSKSDIKCGFCGKIFKGYLYKDGRKKYCSRDCKYASFLKDKPTYRAIHSWVERKLGKPKVCGFCNSTTAKRYHWANISYKYKRDLKDWTRLCQKCHFNFDGVAYKAWETKRTRNSIIR